MTAAVSPLPITRQRGLEIYFFLAAFSSSFALALFSLLPKLRASARATRSSLNTFRDFSASVMARSVKVVRPGVLSMGKAAATDLSCLASAVTSAAESPFLTLPTLRGKRINFDLYSVRRATLIWRDSTEVLRRRWSTGMPMERANLRGILASWGVG